MQMTFEGGDGIVRIAIRSRESRFYGVDVYHHSMIVSPCAP